MIFLYILLGLVVLILALSVIAPKHYDVNRSVVINKPVSQVYNYLKYIKNQDEWSPWAKKDPDMKQTFTGTDGEIGFISRWEGNKDVGTGEQELTHLSENESVLTELRFYKPWESQSDGYFRLEPIDDNTTKVIWGFSGKNKFPWHILMMFMSMEKAVGKDFEEGLADLKTILENK